jgi:hypothetical protein
MAFDLDGYNTVADRIEEFRKKYPEGSLQQVELRFEDFAKGSWVVYTAAAYRTADDLRPGHGTAWEPVPGKTSFTRDSELQNAETAAWGRAIVAALAADAQKPIASREEVRNRQPEHPATQARVVESIITKVDPVLVNEWIETFDAAASLDQLQAAWNGAGAAGVTGDKKVIAAKDRKKAELQNA